MSKKDYEAIAKIMARGQEFIPDGTFEELVDDLCFHFEQDNPLFDPQRFKEACGLP